MQDSAPSDHFDGKRYFNPGINMKGIAQVLRWRLTSRRAKWPDHVENTGKPSLPGRVGPDEIHATFINHATWLIQIAGMNILTDPVWSERVSPFSFAGPKRVREPGLRIEDLPKIDFVLVSHNHYDHMDQATLTRLAKRFQPRFYCAKGDRARLIGFGASEVHEMEWWESVELNWRTRLVFSPTQHWSARGAFDRCRSLWGGFHLISKEPSQHVYFGGDSGYSPWYKEIRRRLGAPDLALLPIGAYEPRWFMKDFHMNPAEAVRAHLDLGAKKTLGMHFGCFQLTDEAIDQPVCDLEVALKTERITPGRFIAPKVGATYQANSRPR